MKIQEKPLVQNESIKLMSSGNLGSWEVSKLAPASHGKAENQLKIILAAGAAILLLSIIFWAVGASVGSPGLELVGKIVFGLSIAAIGIALATICCVFGHTLF